jgi:hypothetical protein
MDYRQDDNDVDDRPPRPTSAPRGSKVHPNLATVPIAIDGAFESDLKISSSSSSSSRPQSARSVGGGGVPAGPGSPETPRTTTLDNNARLQKAKVKMLEKQLEDGVEMRKHLNDQITDLQKQLKTEREENKKMKKRCFV